MILKKTEMTFDVKVNVGEEKVCAKFTMTNNAKKAAKKEIKMPTSVKVYNMDEMMNLENSQAQTEVAAVEAKDTKAETTKADTKDVKAANKAA